jgi:hypothetical protein
LSDSETHRNSHGGFRELLNPSYRREDPDRPGTAISAFTRVFDAMPLHRIREKLR